MGDVGLSLPAIERAHVELAKVRPQTVDGKLGQLRTHRLGNGIVVDPGEAFRSLVLLATLLAAAGRGRGAGRCSEAAPTPSLAVAVAGGSRTWLCLSW